MPKHKKHFIDRKTATSFALVQRSHQDKFADDVEAPQRVLKDISRKKQQQKYGVFFDDDYDYLQHLRRPFSKETEESDDEAKEVEGKSEVERVNDETEADMEENCLQSNPGPELRFHETLMGFDDPMYEGHVVNVAEVDEDILEAMLRAEAGEDEEEGSLPDDFIHLASCAAPDEEDEDSERLTAAQQAMMDHYFDTLGGETGASRLAEFGVSDEDDDEEEDVLQQLRQHRLEMENRGEDYHSQCLGLQIEKLVEDAVSYDVDDIKSRISGVSCALTESMKQAMETDKRLAAMRLVKDPECLVTNEEKAENIARTLAIIHEDSDSEEEEEDPVQAWVDFDRRPRVTSNVDSDRPGYKPMDDILASCTVHPAAVSSTKQKARRREKSTTSLETTEEGKAEMAPPSQREKGESSEERRQRKAIVKAQQRHRRVAKKENKMSFKAETARQRATAPSTYVTHPL